MDDIFYLNGDSWTRSEYVDDHLRSKNINFINKSIGGSGNLNIIQRTKSDLDQLKQQNIFPKVCISLSEVGRDLVEEFKLVQPIGQNLDVYLRTILLKEIDMLTKILDGYSSYITVGWTTNPLDTKSIIDFIGVDLTNQESYLISNGVYNWLSDRQKIFKISKQSFIDTVDKKQKWEANLLSNQYIDETLHINWYKRDPVNLWLDHVLEYFNMQAPSFRK